ncbi:spore germination protein [Peribacillus sp. SCS-155]|uniref:spore germination protein n=1 Tax=Peribacillus sedimenti TaxID=3115297 RepID=UPI003905D429
MNAEHKQIIDSLQLKYKSSKDLMAHEFDYFGKKIILLYLESMSDDEKIKKHIIKPLLLCETENEFTLHLLSLPGCKKISDLNGLEKQLIGGETLIFLSQGVYSYKVTKVNNDQPLEATVEMSVLGPQKALSEDLQTNITLLRTRYPSENLRIESSTIGTLSNTPIALLYDVEFVDKKILKELKKKLSDIKVDMIQAVGQMENQLTDKKYHLFPVTLNTERPDRLALNIAEGKIIILVNGTPFGLVVPAVFFDFISSMDDLSHTYWVSRLMILLRYIGLGITLVLPALYIVITSYNPEIVRSQLALTIAGSRAAVPYPSYFEVVFMMIAVEMLIESSVRLPKAIGPTATTVGGLILGQAAQQAQLVSSIMIIITAFVAISNFTIPVNAMSFAVRCARYPLIILASFFGLVGLVAGVFLILCYLTDLRSFGRPYLKIFWGANRKIKSISERKKKEEQG